MSILIVVYIWKNSCGIASWGNCANNQRRIWCRFDAWRSAHDSEYRRCMRDNETKERRKLSINRFSASFQSHRSRSDSAASWFSSSGKGGLEARCCRSTCSRTAEYGPDLKSLVRLTLRCNGLVEMDLDGYHPGHFREA
jgi:hypothetical protein